MAHFNQKIIIKKLNQYLISRKRSVLLQQGYCHGIALLWLHQISTGNEYWFYHLTQQIADCENDDDFNFIEWDIELFISYIEWLQHSCFYFKEVNQLDIEKLIEIHEEMKLSFLFHHTEIEFILSFIVIKNKLISISSHNHTIALYNKDDNIYMFDANYDKLIPKIINNITLLKLEIITCLFKRNYIPSCRLPLEIIVLSNPSDLSTDRNNKYFQDTIEDIYLQLIKNCRIVDVPGLDGITNMYLACESGNEREVFHLLKNGSNPNQTCKMNDLTPLHIASVKGHLSIVKLLIFFGAIPQANKSGIKPIDLAKKSGHETVAQFLLK